ncbi:MAG: glycosyltransferase family 4 protein [Geobacteraceae bacterium]|nr:glycosyltransferase family 4 protein [Geobacteraceae bacterium]
MKKIALVTYALNVGGMETFMLGLARHLRAGGLDPAFVITDYIGPWHEKPRAEGLVVHTILQSTWQSRIAHTKNVAECLREFDVVLLNHSVSAQSSLGLLPQSLVAISILHNDDESIYAVGLSNQDNIDNVVTVSERLRIQAIARGMPAERVRCIRNGVEVFPGFPKGSRPFDTDGPLRVAFVGRIEHRQKGVFYLPGILARLSARNIPLQMDIIGSGSDLELLRQRVAAADIKARVRFHGSLTHEDAMRLLQAADVLIMPSHYEGQGVVLFEAMARAVVPVASHLSGVTNVVIADGVNGMLVPVGAEEGFAEALATLSGDRQQLECMARAAWQAALKEYSIETMAAEYTDLMTECRGRRNGEMPRRTGIIDRTLLGRYPEIPRGMGSMAARMRNAFTAR